jgi:multiple sugar transport system ATP-binding protein
MGFALRLQGMPRREVDARVEEAAGVLGLDGLLDRYPRQLSGGQRQRVAMGRAIVRRPALFLFDEPLSNLDAKLRVQMRGEIRRMHRIARTTTVYVTHDQVEAMTLADRVVVMRAGEIEQVGAPLDLYDRPETLFVAGFIGSPPMNLLDATLDAGWVRLSAGDWDAGRRGHGPVVAGVRPEHLAVVAEGGLPATVQAVEPTGAETVLICEAEGGAEVQVSLRGRAAHVPGDRLRLAPEAGRLHLFDRATGRRLPGA